MNANVYATKDYENETTLRSKKTNPIQTQFHLPPFLAQIQGFAPKTRKKPEQIKFSLNIPPPNFNKFSRLGGIHPTIST